MRYAAAFLLLGTYSAVVRAEIIDRVAAVVANSIISTSEVDKQVRLTAFFNGTEPDYRLENRRRAAQMLIEQALIRREMAASGSGQTATTDTKPEFLKLITDRYPDEKSYQAALEKYRLTDADVKAQLLWQTQLVEFIDVRFRSAVPLSDSELQEYYENTYVPDWSSRDQGKPPALEDIRGTLEDQAASERANSALDRWLGQTRTQTRIRLMPEAFK